ncbi:MAG: lipopolysaccharide biosynthesis protein [Muribaculaceae bacterium]|nr:lipopolysaccharide biosynthesis protein [Muribaculaceae bacterium]
MAESLTTKTIRGTLWSSIERFSVQGIQFAVMIIMARILTPADYGLVGMLAIFIAISQSLIDSGFSQALIRKQDRSQTDNSTVFFFNIAVGVILYIILFFCAPLIASFYNQPLLTPLTRAIGIGLIFNSLAVVQRALLTVDLDFKTQAKASLIGAIASGAIGIWMAYAGYGVWSIVAQQLCNLALVTIFLWIFSHWKPTWVYSWKSFSELFGFGSKLMLSGLLDTAYRNIYLIVIGKVYKASDLGYFTRAQQFSDLVSSNVTGILQRVTYPVLCSIQDDNDRLKNAYLRILRITSFLMFPLLAGLAGVSRPLVITLLTDKWLFAATLLIPLCLTGMWYPVHAINLNLLQVKGRSDLFLRLEIIKKIVGVIILCATIPLGIITMCWGMLVNSIIALVINTHYTGKLIGIGFFKQIKDILPSLILSLTMSAVVYTTMDVLSVSSLVALIIGVAESVIIYAGIAKFLHFQEFKELLALIKRQQ